MTSNDFLNTYNFFNNVNNIECLYDTYFKTHFFCLAVYSPDMPKRLPLSIVFSGFLGTVAHAVRFWLHYTLVALAWLGVVPLTACRIYRTLFTGSVSSILSLPINVFSTYVFYYSLDNIYCQATVVPRCPLVAKWLIQRQSESATNTYVNFSS